MAANVGSFGDRDSGLDNASALRRSHIIIERQRRYRAAGAGRHAARLAAYEDKAAKERMSR